MCLPPQTDKAYPRALAFEYLEELKSEFMKLYGSEVDTVSKHYAFVKFDTFIQRTRKLYLDHRTHRNLEKLQVMGAPAGGVGTFVNDRGQNGDEGWCAFGSVPLGNL